MKNMKIGNKLLLAFGSCGIMILFVALVGFYAIIMGNIRATDMYEENIAPMAKLIKIEQGIYEQSESGREMLSSEPGKIIFTNAKGKAAISITNMNSLLDEYSSMLVHSDEIDALSRLRASYADHFLPNMETAMDGNFDEKGASVYKNNLTAYRNEVVAVIDELFSFNDSYATEHKSTSDKMLILILSVGIPTVIIVIFWILFLIRTLNATITKPIVKMIDAAKKVSLGETELTIEVKSKDEVGELAAALRRMIEGIKEQVNAVSALAQGDFTYAITARSDNDLIAHELSSTMKSLSNTLLVIRRSAEEVETGASQVSAGAQVLSQGAAEQAASIDDLTTSMTQVSDSAATTSENVRIANEYMDSAVSSVNLSNEHMSDMLVAINNISTTSEEIQKIIKLIDDISFQTNILALNAAVEAAHAGAAGKGFAVVADEVRTLAGKSADAARQTAQLIEASLRAVEEGLGIADQTAKALENVTEQSTKIQQTITEIDEACVHQESEISAIMQGLSQVSIVTQTNSATAEESAATSEELTGQSAVLRDEVHKFILA